MPFANEGAGTIAAIPLRHSWAALRRKMIFFLQALYVFLLPLGNIARFSEQESAFGVTTLILPTIILLALPLILVPLSRSMVIFTLALLVGWLLAASAFSVHSLPAFRNGFSLVLYVLFAAAVRYTVREPRQMVLLILFYCSGAFVSSFLTLIDFAGIVDVPKVNEVTASTHTNVGHILQVSGAFPRRSAMAEYYGPIIAMSALMILSGMRLSLSRRVLFLGAAIGSAISLMLTHNRSGVLAAGIAGLAMVVLGASSWGKLFKSVAIVGAVFAAVALVIALGFPEVWVAYKTLLGLEDTAYGALVRESDGLRLELFEHAMASLLENPVGNGYGLVTGLVWSGPSEFDPHSIFTQIIWGAGIFGIGWLAVFGWQMLWRSWRLLRKTSPEDPFRAIGIVLLGGLCVVVLVGLTHTTISNGAAWFFFGLYLSVLDHAVLAPRPRSA